MKLRYFVSNKRKFERCRFFLPLLKQDINKYDINCKFTCMSMKQKDVQYAHLVPKHIYLILRRIMADINRFTLS